MRNKKKLKFLVGLVILLLAGGYLAYGAVRNSMSYYLTVSELKDKGESIYGERVRIGGRVVDGSIKWDPQELRLEFQISDKDTADVLKVRYKGVVPDTFKNGVEAVVDGTLTAEGVFNADNLLAKCPSKYVPAKAKN